MIRTHNDQPSAEDQLDRTNLARAVARVLETASTPFVVGVYGGWGAGKTSVLRLIEKELPPELLVVRFDAWLHQNDEDPALGLVHAICKAAGLDLTEDEELGLLVRAICGGVAAEVMAALASIEPRELGEKIEADHQRLVEARFRAEHFAKAGRGPALREHLQRLLQRLCQRANKSRVVVLIDDLDRCLPENVLAVLETLKLHLHQPGNRLVAVLAVDRLALEAAVATRYGESSLVSSRVYLDKLIQLGVQLPQPTPDLAGRYVDALIGPHEQLESAAWVIRRLHGTNPRAVKRFINELVLQAHLKETRFDAESLAMDLYLRSNYPEHLAQAEREDPSAPLT